MAVSDYVQRFLAGQGMGGTPVDSDSQDVVRRFLRARGRLRDDVDAADTAEVQRRLAAQAVAPSGLDESVLAPRSQKTSPAAAAPTATDADFNARRAAASRTALVNDVLSGATEGFDRATEWIAGPGPGVRARDRNAVANAEAAFVKSEEERRLLAQRAADKPLTDARKAAELEKLKADTAKSKAATITAEGDAAYEAALRDINSPETQAMREYAVSMSGGKLTNAANLNGLQLREAVKTATSQLNAEAMAGIKREQLTQSAQNEQADRAIAMQGLRLRIAEMESRNRNAELDRAQAKELADMKAELERLKIEAATSEKDAKAEVERGKLVDSDTTKLADDFDKSGGPGFYSKYAEAKALLEKYPDDIPGFGKIDGHKPDMFVSPDALDMRQAVGQMLAEYRKGITGAGMSNAERTEYASITGLLQSNNERSVRQGVERLKRAMDNRIRAVAGGYRSEAVSQYASRVPQFGEAISGSGLGAPPKVGTAANPARSREVTPIEELPEGGRAPPAAAPAPRRTERKSVAPPAAEIPRLISLKKPDGTRKTREEVKAEIAEGETARLPMGKGADGEMRYRTVKKVNGKVEVVEEDE